MYIIEDTKQKQGQHEVKRQGFASRQIEVIRNQLPFGDYALAPKVSVDTKKNMEEIAGNICGPKKEHLRFKQECVRAREAGCQLYILVENEEGITCLDQVPEWKNPRCVYHPDCVQGPRLAKAMETMQERYGCVFLFCRPEEAAGKILELLTGGEKDGVSIHVPCGGGVHKNGPGGIPPGGQGQEAHDPERV